MASKDKPVYYARDINPGDILIGYYDHPPDKMIWCYLVLETREWKAIAMEGRAFQVLDMISGQSSEYRWDGEPLIFDEILKLKSC